MTDLAQAMVAAMAAAPRPGGVALLTRDELRRILTAAEPHMGRPVYVLAVGHDLTDRDAENIQRAVVAALTTTTEGGQAGGT